MSQSKAVICVDNMCCPAEESLIKNKLRSLQGVDDLQIDVLRRELTILHRLNDVGAIVRALDEIGMAPRLPKQPGQPGQPGQPPAHDDAGHNNDGHVDADADGGDDHGHVVAGRGTWLLMGLAGGAAVSAEVVAWTTGRENSPAVIALAVAALLLSGRETFKKGLIALRTMTLNINFLMMVAVAGAIGIGQWPEAAMVTFLFAVAEMIEAFSLDRARNAIRSLMEMTPATALVKVDGDGYEERPASSVNVGDTVGVRPGARIPLDGTVTSGASSVNQAPITGESMPVEKKVGDQVFAGTINEKGSFDFGVTANRGNTTLDRIVRAVQSAQGQRAPTQRFVDRFAQFYTPSVFLIAILVAILPPLLFGAEAVPSLYKALVLLVIACPCALVISTPVTVVSGLAAAAKHGVLVKGGVYLEQARHLRLVALDKTGTLTHGKPVLTDVVPFGAHTREAIVELAARVDAASEHPVASALVAAFTTERGVAPRAVTGFLAIAGRGAKAIVDDVEVFVGNHRLIEEHQMCSPEVEAVLEKLELDGKTAVVVFDATRVLGVMAVADTLKPTSIEAITLLHALGIKAVVLTGDNQRTATAIARAVGLDDARGDLLPEDKLAAIQQLQKEHGLVGMVGDGINDAPALAAAGIGFAMGAAGTDTAIETADVALMDDDLRKLPYFVALGRQTSWILMQNIVLAIGIKVVFFGLAMAGIATLWMAVFADLGASLIVILNGLRLLRSSSSTSPSRSA